MILIFLLCVCLPRGIRCREVKEQGDDVVNSSSIHMQHRTPRNENFAIQVAAEWVLDYNLRKPAHRKVSERQETTMGREWWYKYVSKVHLNSSGNLGLRASRVIRDAPARVRSYSHLDTLILDLVQALNLNFLRMFVNGGRREKLLIQRLARHSTPHWAVWSCSRSPLPVRSQKEATGKGLIVVLCDNRATVNILKQASVVKALEQHVWMLKLVPASVGSLPEYAPHLYVPIDSQVIEVTGEQEDDNLVTLSEVWSPGSDVTLRSGFVGLWTADSEFRGRDTHVPWAIATDRLRLYPKPKYERRNDLSGVHFIVTSINDTRAQKSYFDQELRREVLTGYFGDVWELLRKDMNFTYSVVTPPDGVFGALEGGEWTGLVGDLMNGRAHVVVALLSLTYDRAQVIDYSSVLIKFSYRIFALPQTGTGSWSSYTRPFSMGVWIGVGLTVVSLATIFYMISQWHMRLEMQKQSAGVDSKAVSMTDPQKWSRYHLWKKDSLLLMWAALTQQGWPLPPEANSLRILFWTIYMVGLVVVTAYSATLVSFLTVVDTGLPFDSLAELKKLGGYRLGILKGSVLEEYFRSQNFREYWNALIEPYPDTLATSYGELRSLAMWDSNFAYVGSYEIQRLDRVGACTLQSARQHLLFNAGALGWPKGSPYIKIFDYNIIRLRESGLLQKLARKWYPPPYNCEDEPVIPLGLKQVFTAFVVLGLGAALSILFLNGEKFIQRSTNNNSNQSMKPRVMLQDQD